jgi:hypothetical protein
VVELALVLRPHPSVAVDDASGRTLAVVRHPSAEYSASVILTYQCEFGQPLPLGLAERFGQQIELEALEFISAMPIEWRLIGSDGLPVTSWKPGMPERRSLAFHDLQVPRHDGTSGTPAAHVSMETRGIGSAVLLVWPRIGTFDQGPACH